MNERGDITTDPTDKKSIIRKYNEQLHVNELSSFDEIQELKDTYQKGLSIDTGIAQFGNG